MPENSDGMGSDLAKVDAYVNTPEDYDEIPDMSDADPSLVTWTIGDRIVSEFEGRAAMRAALTAPRDLPGITSTELVELRLDENIVAAFRAEGPDWRDRMTAALRKAVGL